MTEKLISKLYKGLPEGVKKHLIKLYKHLPNSNRVVIKTIDNITYELDLSLMIDSNIYYYGVYEPDTTKFINEFVKKDMVVLDIGANSGCHTLRFAKLVGDKGEVFAFEPTKIFEKLHRNVKLNNFKNVTLENIALSDKNEVKEIAFAYQWSLISSVKEEKELISFITLDEYVQIQKINKIDLIKIDVDGYETKIIRGAQKTLKKFKPVIIIEFGKRLQERYGDTIEKLIELLSSLEYSFYSVDDGKKYGNVLEAIPEKRSINVICK